MNNILNLTTDNIVSNYSISSFLDLGIVNVKSLGASADGITDDTQAIRTAHTIANQYNLKVSYEGCKSIAIQANANITINTDVDFYGCQIKILNGIKNPPDYDNFILYNIYDEDAPLETITATATASNLEEGSLKPTEGILEGDYYCLLESNVKVPNRDKTGFLNYEQSFRVHQDGFCSYPLSRDISANPDITLSYRKISHKPILIQNMNIYYDEDWNCQTVLNCERCNVIIENITIIPVNNISQSINNLIFIQNASDITLNKFITRGQLNSGLGGTYCLSIYGGADIFINELKGLRNWGITGCNYLNGIHYSNCILNRVDTHLSAHNIFIDNCCVHEYGIIYGWGGGLLKVVNSSFYNCNIINSRVDYGNAFYGDMIIENCQITNNKTNNLYCVNLDNLGASSMAIPAPKNIYINGIKRLDNTLGGASIITPLKVSIDGDVEVYAPKNIHISNIISYTKQNSYFGLEIDFLNLEQNPLSETTEVYIDKCYADLYSSTTYCIKDLTKIRTPSNEVIPYFKITNCENIAIILNNLNGGTIMMDNTSVNGIQLNLSGTSSEYKCIFNNCRFIHYGSGFTNIVIGGNEGTGDDEFTTIMNSQFSADNNWVISNASVLIGNIVYLGSQTPVIPGSITIDDIFTGFKSSKLQ